MSIWDKFTDVLREGDDDDFDDFYNENDYVIMSDLSAKADEAERTGDYSAFTLPGDEWLEKPYQENEEIRRSYSIHAFIEKVFN